MKRIFQILALSLMLVAVPVLSVHAQDIKLVTGRIINKTTRKPFDAKNIIIYTFNTTGEAEDAYKTLTEGNGIIFTTNMVSPDASGYYEVRVAETGAIIVKEDMVNKCAMEQVNYRMEINFEIEGGNVLDQAVVSGTLTEPTPLKERNRMNGNNLEVGNVIPLPAHFGKTNARMILQPVLYEGGTDRLVKYLKPLVYDGEQYKLTQERRMGYVDARGNNHPNYHYEDLEILCGLYAGSGLRNPAVIVDTNHSNSGKKYLEQIRIAKEVLHSTRCNPDIYRLVKGLMIESYIEDGCQKAGEGVYGKSITDPCLGWEKTERLIYELAELR